MNAVPLLPAHRPDLITLELGERCFGVTTVAHDSPLDFQPIPAARARPDQVRGVVRLGDGTEVPVFDLRAAASREGPYRMLVASGYRGEDQPISMAFLIDAPVPAAAAPGVRRRAPAAPVLTFSRN